VDLFRGARDLIIVHNNEEYRLRITRLGKLILTKKTVGRDGIMPRPITVPSQLMASQGHSPSVALQRPAAQEGRHGAGTSAGDLPRPTMVPTPSATAEARKIPLAQVGPNGSTNEPRDEPRECRERAMTELFFLGIKQHEGTSPPALMLRDAANQRILAVGEEADLPLVCRALHREGCGRESVFGLVHDLLMAAGATAVAVGLNVEGEGTLVATVRFELAGTPTSLLCRPAEAVLLAVRLGAPIFASSRLTDQVDRGGESVATARPTLRVREWLARVRPEDFLA
jgi:bifunctional DNase/RNase